MKPIKITEENVSDFFRNEILISVIFLFVTAGAALFYTAIWRGAIDPGAAVGFLFFHPFIVAFLIVFNASAIFGVILAASYALRNKTVAKKLITAGSSAVFFFDKKDCGVPFIITDDRQVVVRREIYQLDTFVQTQVEDKLLKCFFSKGKNKVPTVGFRSHEHALLYQQLLIDFLKKF